MEERERKSAESDVRETAASGGSTTPALPEREAAAQRDDAERTDVCSGNFDPLAALYSPAVPLPFPNIRGFNNVAAYESFMKGGRGRAKPENVEKRRRKATKGVADPERIARLKKLIVNNPVSETGEGSGGGARRRRQKPQKNVLTRMPLCKGSPMGELYRCVEERIRVKVHIRTFKGLRGVCSGFVVAFDKFWNMLFGKLKLQENPEGDEPEVPGSTRKEQPERGGVGTQPEEFGAVRTKRDKGAASTKALGPEGRQTRGSQKYGKVQTRHINQLFIRGENVLLVNPQPL
ncbi:U7 snRNA-associated Sm-like protein LSm11 isoform 2-T2 [Spinachia spinachia]